LVSSLAKRGPPGKLRTAAIQACIDTATSGLAVTVVTPRGRPDRENAVQMSSSRSEEARNRAQDLFAKAKQRDADVIEHRTKLQKAGLEKYNRLRALRLAKEAADKEALHGAAAAKQASSRKPKTPNA
jgi:hypothetical protein